MDQPQMYCIRENTNRYLGHMLFLHCALTSLYQEVTSVGGAVFSVPDWSGHLDFQRHLITSG